MRADGLLELQTKAFPYGPSLVATERSKVLQKLYRRTLDQYDKQLNFVAGKLGNKGVADLEQLAGDQALAIRYLKKKERQI